MRPTAVSRLNIQAHWARRTPLSVLLLPLAGLFALVVWFRRAAYRQGWLQSFTVGVPVIVVGNITAGGSGKTPLVIWLVGWLAEQGYRPGVVSRGYRGKAEGCVEVRDDSDPSVVGDEPLLIHAKTRCPLVVGRDRVAAARVLLARHPGIDIIVSDDGLQHYRLHRNLELAVVDAATGLGNGLSLPAGPLREPASRLDTVDAVLQVRRGGSTLANTLSAPSFQVEFRPGKFYALCQPERKIDAEALGSGPWLAVTGIGRPQGFFDMLSGLGLKFRAQVFPDHYRFTRADLPSKARVVMTEKDAVKCIRFAQPDWWALELETQPERSFMQWLELRLNNNKTTVSHSTGEKHA